MGGVAVLAIVTLLATIGLGTYMQESGDLHLNLAREQELAVAPGCFSALFSFGSSVADTGTKSAIWPTWSANRPPYGTTFFGKPSRRSCDGRLHIDFWATALGFPFLDSYFKSVGSNFYKGVNFAAAGATACDVTNYSPFDISMQLGQFQQYKRDLLTTINLSGSQPESRLLPNSIAHFDHLPLEKYFVDALYVIAIGGNDFLKWFVKDNLTVPEVASQLPKSFSSILAFVKGLYDGGARNILVENLHPVGCMPSVLTPIAQRYPNDMDAAGCIKPVNDLVQLHNSLLKQGIVELGARFQDASISVIDTYSKRYDIIANYEQYGFLVPIRACCGAGGDYNFNPNCQCSYSLNVDGQLITADACANISSHVMWDGIHFTEAVNLVVMKSILAGNDFDPPFDLSRNGCTLANI